MKEKNQNHRLFIISIGLLLGFSLIISGCVKEDNNNAISVLVTIVPQQEMVSAIGGEYVDVTVMVPAGESPHSFEPSPGKMIKVSEALAYFKVGSGVEFELTYMDTIIENNPDLILFDCSKDIKILSFDEHYGKDAYHSENNTQTQDQGEKQDHDHGGTDPHIWTSPVNFNKMASVVYEGLVEIDPDHQHYYYSTFKNYTSKIRSLHQNITHMLTPFEGNAFMVYHPAWGYFGDTYNLTMLAIEDEGKQPGPAGIKAIINQAKNEHIKIIFVSPQFDTSNAETIANEINGEVALANPLTDEYHQALHTLAETIATAYS